MSWPVPGERLVLVRGERLPGWGRAVRYLFVCGDIWEGEGEGQERRTRHSRPQSGDSLVYYTLLSPVSNNHLLDWDVRYHFQLRTSHSPPDWTQRSSWPDPPPSGTRSWSWPPWSGRHSTLPSKPKWVLGSEGNLKILLFIVGNF